MSGPSPYGGIATRSNPQLHPTLKTTAEASRPGGVFLSNNTNFNADNNGSPCFRLRPRYNSEYMWNKGNLDALLPIGGQELDYQCSIMWFCYPGDMPTTR